MSNFCIRNGGASDVKRRYLYSDQSLFPGLHQIGYAKDLERRLQQLNRSETIPFAFRAYAVYEVESALTDKELHKLIDRLNPDLRSIETFDGRERVKEFDVSRGCI